MTLWLEYLLLTKYDDQTKKKYIQTFIIRWVSCIKSHHILVVVKTWNPFELIELVVKWLQLLLNIATMG